MLKLEIEILSERQASLTLGTGAVPSNEFIVTADDIDELIEVLGGARMALKEEIPRELGPSARVRSICDPILHVHRTIEGMAVLCVRDPAFGWTALELAASTAQELARVLSNSIAR